MDSHRRASPDSLLESVNKLENSNARGALRVFFGMCPGVGKTYAMLEAAQEQQKRGVQVLVGVIETHQRHDTAALLKDLTVLAKAQYRHNGHEYSEMDLDAILQIKPPLVLVDELAHTNAPLSRHTKRYQDVEEILNAGIDVYTTLNVQHLESRKDTVEQITGVAVRETVPDHFLDMANQIELVDITPMELRERLRAGKVYMGEMAERAADNFFKEEHLIALREMALRFTAELVDRELREQLNIKQISGPWGASERLMVAINHSPHSQRLLRTTRRMAASLEAPWTVLYVQTSERLSEDDRVQLKRNLDLARRLGGDVVTTQDLDLVNGIKRIAEDRKITQIVMGRPDRRFIRDLLNRGTILQQLVREKSQVDVHVIRQDRPGKAIPIWSRWPEFHFGFTPYLNTFICFLLLTFMSKWLVPLVGYRAVGFVFLLGVLTVASFARFGPILFSAFLSTFVWNFAFIPPLYTFVISSWDDIMMCVAYFVVALAAGTWSNLIRRQKELLLAREKRSNILYDFVKNLSECSGIQEICQATAKTIESVFDGQIRILLADKKQELISVEGISQAPAMDERDQGVANWSHLNREPAGWTTQTLAATRSLALPLIGRNGTLGVMLYYPRFATSFFALDVEKEEFLQLIVRQLAVTLEREALTKESESNRLLEQSEVLHQTLLNSVSHELRTPLTSIIGNATSLLDERMVANPVARTQLIEGLVLSTQRLNHVVENLLDMSRLTSGVLTLNREWAEANDFVEQTVSRLQREMGLAPVRVETFPSKIFFNGDCKLLEHALSNLVLNALAYSPGGAPVTVALHASETKFRIEVRDQGKGFTPDVGPLLFDKFYRAEGSSAGGMGLGLSIVKSIIELHGGHVYAESSGPGQGATFTVELIRDPLPDHFVDG